MTKEPVDPARVASALKRVTPLLGKLPRHLRMSPKEARALALQGVAMARRANDYEEAGAPLVFGGDLVVDGSFDLGCLCIVMGDLRVKGVIDARHDDAALVVGGSIDARGVTCTECVFAGGSIAAEVVFLEAGGQVIAGGGVRTKLAIFEDVDADVTGRLEAEQKVNVAYPSTSGIAFLKKTLAPSAFGTVDGDEALFDYTNLFATLRAGKSWRRGAGANAKKARARAPAKGAPSTNAKSKRARYFEFVEGSSNKFWEVKVDGASVTTRYGRLGTAGQTTTKKFESAEKARAAAAKLVGEKTAKGYREG